MSGIDGQHCPSCARPAIGWAEGQPRTYACEMGHRWHAPAPAPPPRYGMSSMLLGADGRPAPKAESAKPDTGNPGELVRYINGRLNEMLNSFEGDRNSPAMRKMIANAVGVELRKIADELGYNDVTCTLLPSGEFQLGISNVGFGEIENLPPAPSPTEDEPA